MLSVNDHSPEHVFIPADQFGDRQGYCSFELDERYYSRLLRYLGDAELKGRAGIKGRTRCEPLMDLEAYSDSRTLDKGTSLGEDALYG
jgi:hypothetical protein